MEIIFRTGLFVDLWKSDSDRVDVHLKERTVSFDANYVAPNGTKGKDLPQRSTSQPGLLRSLTSKRIFDTQILFGSYLMGGNVPLDTTLDAPEK